MSLGVELLQLGILCMRAEAYWLLIEVQEQLPSPADACHCVTRCNHRWQMVPSGHVAAALLCFSRACAEENGMATVDLTAVYVPHHHPFLFRPQLSWQG